MGLWFGVFIFCSVKSFVLCKVDLSLCQALSGASGFQLVPHSAPDHLSLVSTGAPGPLFGVGVHAWGAPHARRGMSMASMVIAPLGSCTQTFPYPWLLIG